MDIMPPRRPHTKSRHGCDRCRRRRIKCDEGGPPCTNCAARNTECQYSTGRLFQHFQYDAQFLCSPAPQETETHQSTMEHRVNDSETRLNAGLSPSLSCSPSPNRMRELELMHQWCMKTHHSFSSDLSDVFGTYAVKQALHHPFLMDSLLALSSLHIANDLASANAGNIKTYGPKSVSPEDYIIDALHYQNQAAPAFRAALEHISPSNCNALFACSAIMMACAVVSSISQSGEDASMSTLTALLPFIKGVHVVIDRAREWLARGPFGLVMQCHPDEDWLLFQPGDVELLPSGIRKLYCLRSNASDVYTRGIVMLGKCYVKADAMVLPWLVVVGDEFVGLVQEGRLMALLIYMCWGVLLNRLEGIWWARVSGRRIVMQLILRLAGIEEWDDIVNWAKEEVGFD